MLDNNNESLPGASIVVKGTTRGVTTDLDGVFNLDVKDTDVIVVSFIGMITQYPPEQLHLSFPKISVIL